MPKLDFVKSVAIARTARATQLEGLFDVPPAKASESRFAFELPIEERPWQLGLIYGASGSGKSSAAAEAFAGNVILGYDWPADECVCDGFAAGLSIKDICAALSSVGFSSPPSWLRPFRCLSTGEQFRATLARALLDPRPLVCLDEFTSVVDRQVAKIGSAAVAKAVRRAKGRQLVAVTCHYDVEEWLDPDWTLEMPLGKFEWRLLRQRPPITLEIGRAHHSAWELFRPHHYLNTSLNQSAKCIVAFHEGRPAAFASCVHSPGKVSFWREHRTVCLPDFQGVGIGNAVSEFLAGCMAAEGRAYFSTTGNPAMIKHRAKSPLWKMARAPSIGGHADAGPRQWVTRSRFAESRSTNRLTAGFRYVGPKRLDDARRLDLFD